MQNIKACDIVASFLAVRICFHADCLTAEVSSMSSVAKAVEWMKYVRQTTAVMPSVDRYRLGQSG